ncbi:MAG TPA: carboxypeptidase regulatory-like domain-containing protein, partial [Thermoanaerobaculia bacterium]
MTAGTALSGTVVAEDGKTPVAGAAILVDGWPITTSGQDGTFTIPHAPAKWQLVAAKSGALIGTRARSVAPAALVVKLAKSATLNGSIRDMKTQSPVGGAYVGIGTPMRVGAGPQWSAITDAKGNFAVTGIIPGSYQLMAGRPGYSIAPVTISLTANEKLTKPMSAAQLARISGTIVDEQKRPVAAARVVTQNVSRGEGGPMNFMMMMSRAPQAAASAPDGTFNVRADGDTDIQVEALKKGFPQAKSAKLRLAPGERKSGLLLTIPSGVNVTGRVLDKGGKPIAGATVAATESTGGGGGNFMRRVAMNAMRQRDDDQIKTGKDGTYAIRVKEGSYDFAFKADGFAAKSIRAVQIAAKPKSVDVTLEPGVEITGRVTRSGVGVEGVSINLLGEGGMSGNEMTGPDGSFRLTDLSPGQFMLNAMKQDEFIQQIRPVNAPASDVNIDVPAGGRISGHVVDKTSKQPVTAFDAGVSTPRGGGGMVFAFAPAMRHFTSDDGTFVLENVPPGQTQIVVNAPGYTSARLPNINVEDGKSL